MNPMSRNFVTALERYVARHHLPLVQFRSGERKDAVMAEHLGRFGEGEGVVFIGKAQEKTKVFRTEKRLSPTTGNPYPWIVRSTAMVNHYYVYAVDRDFGPFFLKFCTYFPFNAKLCLNGHEYAKQQLARKGIAFEALDNGILSCADPARLQQICDGLSADKIDGLLRKWLRLLPHPFTGADRAAGYRYDISILQAEFSLTQVLDRPAHGRLLFEQVIRENLDLGRPEPVQLIFGRRITRRTPGRRQTRVLTQGVTPSLHVYYKNTRIKQYHKETGRCVPRPPSTIPTTSASAGASSTCPSCAWSALPPIAGSSKSSASATIVCSPRRPSRASTTRSLPGSNAPQACALPIRVFMRCCKRSLCSVKLRKASAAPIYASISPPSAAAIRNQSRKALSPTSCAACVCMA